VGGHVHPSAAAAVHGAARHPVRPLKCGRAVCMFAGVCEPAWMCLSRGFCRCVRDVCACVRACVRANLRW
jgi:hypothetical protein